MSIRALLVIAAAAALVTVLGILGLDAVVARAIGPDAGTTALAATLADLLQVLDRVTLMLWPKKEQLAIALLVAGGAVWWWSRPLGHVLLLFGLVHAVSRTLGGHLKPLFGRLRPTEALAAGHVDDPFFRDGIAFPSGHVAHYAAIAFVVAYRWPPARIPALAVLGFVICARVGVNAHFVSDAAGSIVVAALATAAAAALLSRLRSGTAAASRRA